MKQILFIQGGGENGYQADKALILSLKEHLGKKYEVNYPEIQSDETSPDYGWTRQIGEFINRMNDDLILPYPMSLRHGIPPFINIYL